MSKIKSNLSLKIFLGIFFILLSISLTMFYILKIFMPKTYADELAGLLLANVKTLARQLEVTPQEQWENILIQFCLTNNEDTSIFNENNEQIAGFSISVYTVDDGVAAQKEDNYAASLNLTFEKDKNIYMIVVYTNTKAVNQVTGIFTKIFPYVLITVIIMSTLAAFFYSRFLAKPIVNISNVSKKMTALNMSWRCDVKRSDEIGILADNLNNMAINLSDTLSELQSANEKLSEDIEREREQERRRRDFFSAISHELKTPVTILKGELEGMILNIGRFKDRDKYLQEAYQTTEAIEKLVREILTLAKVDTLSIKLENVKLSSLVDECLMMHKRLSQDKHIQTKCHYESECLIKADKKQIQNAISNIIGNAINHSPEGSIVDICISQQSSKAVLDNDLCNISSEICAANYQAIPKIILSIENSGIHINNDELSKIWEPFYRLDKSRSKDTGGSGLGLYIVKSILELHRFEYMFENTYKGMKFTIIFPL